MQAAKKINKPSRKNTKIINLKKKEKNRKTKIEK
jgi:hypothetical protein